MRTCYLSFFALLFCISCSKQSPLYINDDAKGPHLMVLPLTASINKETTLDYTAVLVKEDGQQTDVTQNATWQSSQSNVASIDANGKANAIAPGSLSITAIFDDLTASVPLTVTDKPISSLTVFPAEAITLVGLTTQFNATLYFTDGTHQIVNNDAIWTSASSTLAEVNSTGLVTGIAQSVSPVAISASFSSVSGQGTIEVLDAEILSLDIYPSPDYLFTGAQEFYRASIILDTLPTITTIDVTDDVAWSVVNSDIATINNAAGFKGHLQALEAGETQVVAVLSYAQKTLNQTADLYVEPLTLASIDVTPKDTDVTKGTYGNFVAIGTFSDNSQENVTRKALWSSSDPNVGIVTTIGENAGLAYAVNSGTTDISACIIGICDSVIAKVRAPSLQRIEIIPDNAEVPLGIKQSFKATGYFSDTTVEDITLAAYWTSGDESVAIMDAINSGIAHTLGEGETTVTASFLGQSGSAMLSVTTPALERIEVSPENSSMPKQVKLNFKARGFYNNNTEMDLTQDVLWSSSTPGIATISNTPGNKGEAFTINEGATIISAEKEGKSDNGSLVVTTDLASFVTPSCEPAVINVGETVQCNCTLHVISGGPTIDCTDVADYDVNIAGVLAFSKVIGEEGLATGIAAGHVDVNIIFNGKNGHRSVSVEE